MNSFTLPQIQVICVNCTFLVQVSMFNLSGVSCAINSFATSTFCCRITNLEVGIMRHVVPFKRQNHLFPLALLQNNNHHIICLCYFKGWAVIISFSACDSESSKAFIKNDTNGVFLLLFQVSISCTKGTFEFSSISHLLLLLGGCFVHILAIPYPLTQPTLFSFSWTHFFQPSHRRHSIVTPLSIV